jgi:quinol monooxygenase YgiN
VRARHIDERGGVGSSTGEPIGEGAMYGTVARVRVKPENREALRKVFERQTSTSPIEGFVTSYVLFENDSDVAWMFVVFADRATYDRNADDPAMHDRYVEYRALMEEDPEWHDGVIEAG